MQKFGQPGSGPMQHYRLYFFDGAGHFWSAPYEFQAPDDRSAMKVAEAWREGRALELWCGNRRVRLDG